MTASSAPAQLKRELATLIRQPGENAQAMRARLVDQLRDLIARERRAAQAELFETGDGRKCAARLSSLEDEVIRALYDYTVENVYPITNPSDTERMAIVATGGYGRGLLAPGSDVDLLFLLPYKQTPWGESVVEHILYILWDLKQKVGHATRTVDQCIRLSQSDMTIRTAILDGRLILGDEGLFRELEQRFEREILGESAAAFIEAKLAERDERHKRTGESRYRVEPNIKDGKGGLRDLHTLHWLAKYCCGRLSETRPIQPPVFTSQERAIYDRCERYLWAVRCILHFLTGRAEERLSFDVQPELAATLGYASRGGMIPVERFMKHYFHVAKEVGDLTAVLCSALEVAQLKTSPRLGSILNPLTWRMRRRVRATTDFRIDNGRLNVADEKVFERDPSNLIRIFSHAEETQTFFHPEAMRLIRRSLPLIGDRLRNDPEANRIFLGLLAGSRGSPEAILRRMNEAGVLGRFMPEFGKVVSMMQFNMYHHFTVDEHLVRTVGQLYEIERGSLAKELPLSTRIFSSIQGRRVLFLAGFIHDIGKGRQEDHSILGARMARAIAPRLGMTEAETETVAWLVEHHLLMSNTAQSRDLADPRTIHDFAAVVQTAERLKLLLLLTVADIRAVGPGTWNGWKGQLLRTLYAEAEIVITGGHALASHKERVKAAQDELRAALAAWPKEEVEAFIERHYPDYWLKFDVGRQKEHAELMRRATKTGKSLATEFRTDEFTAVTELTVLAPNHPRLLSLFAGACAHAGANIVGAQISSTRDGMALDTFQLQRENLEADERRRAERIADTIGRLLEGKARIGQLMAKRRPVERRVAAFAVTPEVMIDNALSDRLTVIQVSGRDRTGLLYEVTSRLSDLSLDIASAHIATFGEKAVDVFYVTDLTGKKIMAEARQRVIIDSLASVLASHGGIDSAAPEPVLARS